MTSNLQIKSIKNFLNIYQPFRPANILEVQGAVKLQALSKFVDDAFNGNLNFMIIGGCNFINLKFPAGLQPFELQRFSSISLESPNKTLLAGC